MSFDRRYAVRLFLSMSKEDARLVLGLPSGRALSQQEIQKAYRAKAIENHPDRGGDHKRMVEINVAKEILDGKLREDRTPYNPPKKTPEEEEREHRARKLDQALRTLSEEEVDVAGYLKFAFLRSAPDLTLGRIDIKNFLTNSFADVLDKISDEIDGAPQKGGRAWQAADKMCQSLTSKALRLGSKFGALQSKRALLVSQSQSRSGGVTVAEMDALVRETARAIASWDSLYIESKKFIGLIRTSEDLPLVWDDLYSNSHEIIYSFKNNFTGISDQDFSDFEAALKRSLEVVNSILGDFGVKAWSLSNWRTPSSYQEAKGAIQHSG